MIIDLSNKTAIVTGSTRGIGLAIATLLAKANANVVISGRSQEKCDDISKTLLPVGSGKIIGIDGSDGMLKQADKKIQTNKWGHQISLEKTDLSEVTLDYFKSILPQTGDKPPKILITLGLTTLLNWEYFFQLLIHWSPEGTRFAMMDVLFKEHSLSAKICNFIGGGTFIGTYGVTQYVFKVLKNNVSDYNPHCNASEFSLVGRGLVGGGHDCIRIWIFTKY